MTTVEWQEMNGQQSSGNAPQRKAKPQAHIHPVYGPMIADGIREYVEILGAEEDVATGAEKRRLGHARYLMRLFLGELDEYHGGQA